MEVTGMEVMGIEGMVMEVIVTVDIVLGVIEDFTAMEKAMEEEI